MKYKLDDSFWLPLDNICPSTFFDAQTKIKPTVKFTASVDKISEERGNYDLVIETSFFNEKGRKYFIQYKAIASLEFKIENEEKNFIDLARFYEKNYYFIENFIFENSF